MDEILFLKSEFLDVYDRIITLIKVKLKEIKDAKNSEFVKVFEFLL